MRFTMLKEGETHWWRKDESKKYRKKLDEWFGADLWYRLEGQQRDSALRDLESFYGRWFRHRELVKKYRAMPWTNKLAMRFGVTAIVVARKWVPLVQKLFKVRAKYGRGRAIDGTTRKQHSHGLPVKIASHVSCYIDVA